MLDLSATYQYMYVGVDLLYSTELVGTLCADGFPRRLEWWYILVVSAETLSGYLFNICYYSTTTLRAPKCGFFSSLRLSITRGSS